MHGAMLLHNELQRQARVRSLTWDDQRSGPGHQATWTCTVYIDEIEYGTGSASSKQGARDAAARMALQALLAEVNQFV
ncbi:hypothetical protein K439DRAFT_1637564, partial [Ramaria rubella]